MAEKTEISWCDSTFLCGFANLWLSTMNRFMADTFNAPSLV